MRALRDTQDIGDVLDTLDIHLCGLIEEWTGVYLEFSQMQTGDERGGPKQKEERRRLAREIVEITQVTDAIWVLVV